MSSLFTYFCQQGNLIVRDFPETEVAFFATVTPHDVHNLAADKAIIFDNAVINIGGAYHHWNGDFVAPVPGTYVFTVTLCTSHDSNKIDGHMYANVYVNGVAKANLLIHAYEQSSQTIVAQLQTGDEVYVVNHTPDEDLIGDKFSTFSGFLLYQSSGSQTAIIG